MRRKTVQVILHNHVAKVKKYVNSVLEQRLNQVSETLVQELQETLSRPGPSKPDQPPGITKLDYKERVPGGLMRSIKWTKDKKKLIRHIGTPLERGFWLEMGTHGGKIIRPINAKALMVPISEALAMAIQARRKRKNKGAAKSGAGKGKGGSRKRVSRVIDVFKHANGHWFALMKYVIMKPMAPRPWLVPTMNKNLRNVGLTLSQKIN